MRNKKLSAILFGVIFLGCSDKNMQTNGLLYEGDPYVNGAGDGKVGLVENEIWVDHTPQNLTFKTEQSIWWFSSLETIVDNDTTVHHNGTEKVYDKQGGFINESLREMKTDDIQISKPSQNTNQFTVRVEENKTEKDRQFIIRFGVNRNASDYLRIYQSSKK